MPKKNIKLGKPMPGIPAGVIAVAGKPENPAGDEMFYPTLDLEWEDNYELPESGTMTVKFKTASETNDKNGQRVSLEITEIVDAYPDKDKDEESTGDRLDKEFKKAEKKERKAKRKSLPEDSDDEVEVEVVEVNDGITNY